MVEEGKILEKKHVASLTTNSLKEILQLFPYEEDNKKFCVTKLRASSSKGEKDTPQGSLYYYSWLTAGVS